MQLLNTSKLAYSEILIFNVALKSKSLDTSDYSIRGVLYNMYVRTLSHPSAV